MKSQYEEDRKIRNQHEKISKIHEALVKSINGLKEQRDKLKENAPNLEGILSDLGDRLNDYLRNIGIKNRRGIKISEKTLVPVVRDRDYHKITSGGLRTIVSIGHLLSILDYSISHDTNHPRLLMIDTVGKYLGKTNKKKYEIDTDKKADIEEGLSDPLKYQNIYESLLSVARNAKTKDVACQIILVDNDVPDSFVNMYQPYIVAHYSSTGENGLSVGLIDDIES